MPDKTTRILCFVLITGLIILPLVLFSSGFFASATEKVLPGVEIMGIELDGLDRNEGMEKLADLEKKIRGTRVILRYRERSWPLPISEAGFGINREATMNAALNAGKEGSLVRRLQMRRQIEKWGFNLQPVLTRDREKLARVVKDLTREITTKPIDASFQINSNEAVSVIPAKDGTVVDIERLEKDITAVLLNSTTLEVPLALKPLEPDRSTAAAESMGINGLLAGYTTNFDQSKENRSYNIGIAARALDEQLVGPGEEFSFNKVVGPRSSEAGYKTAPVIVNNRFEDGLGGGVCQVSTTLYNSVLLANLEATERANHALAVSYVPVGRDATVSYDGIDFKFRNNTGSYIYLKTNAGNGRLTIKIYGNTDYKRQVLLNTWITEEIEQNVIYENNPTLPKGERVVRQAGSKGFKAAGERVVLLDGVVEKKEPLPFSEYSPLDSVIAVGTKEKVLPKDPVKPPGENPASASIPEAARDRSENGLLP